LGWVYYKKGLFNQAEWLLEEALELIERDADKKSGFIHHKAIFSYHLALNFMETDQMEEAKEKLRFAVDAGLPEKYEDHALQVLESGSEN
jgi:tetratricopeptide (TPR) repeat protein